MTDEIKTGILTEHLPYELDMLEVAFEFLHSGKHANLRSIPFCKNSAIESFWLHARNLIEFLAHAPNNGTSGTVSARDFSPGYRPELIMRNIDQRINAGVSHLLYERKIESEEKLRGHDMLRVKQHIDREMKKFEDCLSSDYVPLWTKRTPSEWIETHDWFSSTNSTTSISLTVGGNFDRQVAGP